MTSETHETIQTGLFVVGVLGVFAIIAFIFTYKPPTRPGELVVEGGTARCVCPEVKP